MISLRTLRSEPRKLERKLKVVRIGIQGSKQTGGEAPSCCSAVAPSQTVVRTELQATTAPTMPNVVESPPDYAFWCFPHASPALTSGAGKRQAAPKGRSKSRISLRKIGAGEGIRTLDPNLGKVLRRLTPEHLFVSQSRLSHYRIRVSLAAVRPKHILPLSRDFRSVASPLLPRPPPEIPGKQIENRNGTKSRNGLWRRL